MIYMIRVGDDGAVKIGFTSIRANERLSALQTNHSQRLSIIRLLEGGKSGERQLHSRFADFRLVGEWFSFVPEMLVADIGYLDLPIPSSARRVQAYSGGKKAKIIPCSPGDITPQDIERLANGAGVFVSEVCRRAGVSHALFSRWKSGQSIPMLTTYKRLRDAALALTPAPQSQTKALA
jgi:Meiotically up-regulated gene 113